MRKTSALRVRRALVLSLLVLAGCLGPPPSADEGSPAGPQSGADAALPVEIETADEVIVLEKREPATEMRAPEGTVAPSTPPRASAPSRLRADRETASEAADGARYVGELGSLVGGEGGGSEELSRDRFGRRGKKVFGTATAKSKDVRRSRSRAQRVAGGVIEIPPGLQAKTSEGQLLGFFPLRHSDVDAEAAGWLATTRLTQTFENKYEQVVEAVYVFPLPTAAAVNDFVMEIGGRRIVGVVRPREEAAAIYAAARARGQTASLMSQERTNIFTQSVANIEPGGSVNVSITYFHELEYDEGAFEYVFPMVVGPRFMPGAPQPGAGEASDAGAVLGGGGISVDTTDVPDASRISPPVLPEGMRSGRDVSLKLSLDAGIEIRRIESPSHTVTVQRDGAERATVTLNGADHIPNRDLVVRWRVQSEDVEPGFVAHRTEAHGGFFSAFLVPQLDPGDAEVTPREVSFVIDSSGSMRGIPIDTCKTLVEKTLRQMRSYDRFNIIRFAGSSGSLAEAPIDVTPENVERGVAYLQNLKGKGGTQMLAGIDRWLSQPRDARYLRIVVFLTDGYVGNEDAIHAVIRGKGQDARWFSFGIGNSVNRQLVEGIAELGNGAVEVVLPKEEGAALAAADRLYRRFDSPMLVDVSVDAGGLPIADVYPKRMPDLFAGEPIKITGRYTGAASGEIVFRGRVGDREVAMPVRVELPADEPGNVALASVWARTRIKDLTQQALGADAEIVTGLEKQIEDLAVEFRLVSKRTSFVAVDESRIVGDGKPLRVLQPVEIPEGVSYAGAVGPEPGTRGVKVASWGVTFVEAADGGLVVAIVDEGSAASRAKLAPGDVVTSVGGHVVRGVGHLEALFLQSHAATLEVGFKHEDEPAKATLSRP